MDMRERLRQLVFGTRRVKVPTILQMEAAECGAASLAMILAYYGKWIPLEKLRQECGVTRDGSNAHNIIEAAKHLGCRADGRAGHNLGLKKKEYPLILFWEFNHFLVLEGIVKDTVYLNDPAMGRRVMSWKEFRTSYSGVYLEIRPGENFRPEGERYSIVKALAEKLAMDKWAVLFVLILGLCMVVPGIAVPVMGQLFIDEIFSLNHPEWTKPLFIAMAGAMLLSGIMTGIRAAVLNFWRRKLTISDSSSFFWHVLRLPLAFFQQRYAADIASRIQFNEANARVLSGQAATAVLDFLIAVFYLGLLLQYSVALTLVGVSVTAIDIFMLLYMRRNMTDLTMRIQQDRAKESGTLMAGLMMIESIKANGSEGDLFAKWAGYATKAAVATQDMQYWALKLKLIPSLLAGLNSALIMTVGGFSIMEGVMTAGVYTAFNNLIGRF